MTGDTRSVVTAYVKAHPGASPASVAAATGLNRDTVKKAMQRAAAAGSLRTDGRGHYYAAGRRHLSPVGSGRDTGDVVRQLHAVQASADGDIEVSGTTAAVAGRDSDPFMVHPRCPCCHWRAAQPVRAGQIAYCEACGMGNVAEAGQ